MATRLPGKKSRLQELGIVDRYATVEITACPPTSKLLKKQLEKEQYNSAGGYICTFTPDVGGRYTIQLGAAPPMSIGVAEKFTRQLSVNSNSATVTVYFQDGLCVATAPEYENEGTPVTPSLTNPQGPYAQMALAAPAVQSALESLANKTAASIAATRWAALVQAWTAALAAPPVPTYMDSASVELLQAGWSKS